MKIGLCMNCKAWAPYQALTGHGDCRVRSPRVIVVGDTHEEVTRWPETYKEAWCGEFVDKNERPYA